MKKYTTNEGDTWDIIAFVNYPGLEGEKCVSVLMDANPIFAWMSIFSAGYEINIPEIEPPVSQTLPPWVE